MAVPLGSAEKVVTFGGNKRRVMSFRVAGVALCEIPTCSITCLITSHNVSRDVSKVDWRDRRNTFASFSEDDFHFSWQARHFGHVHLIFAWLAQYFRRVVFHALCESHCQDCVKR